MMGKSHLVISTGVTLSILGLSDQKITLPVAAVTALSSLLPDIDEPNSLLLTRTLPARFMRYFQLLLIGLGIFIYYFGRAFAPWNIVLAALVGMVSFLPTRSLRNMIMILIGAGMIILGNRYVPWNFVIGSLLIICSIVPHRGLTHTIYGVAGWSALLYFSSIGTDHNIWIAGGLSYLIHLLADSVTNHGIRPIPPLNWRLRLNLMSTGTWSGTIVETSCMALTMALVWFVFFRHTSL